MNKDVSIKGFVIAVFVGLSTYFLVSRLELAGVVGVILGVMIIAACVGSYGR
jgi:hypothetical protein